VTPDPHTHAVPLDQIAAWMDDAMDCVEFAIDAMQVARNWMNTIEPKDGDGDVLATSIEQIDDLSAALASSRPSAPDRITVNRDDLRDVLLHVYVTGENVPAFRAARDRLRAELDAAS
jgi:hypothetical protein